MGVEAFLGYMRLGEEEQNRQAMALLRRLVEVEPIEEGWNTCALCDGPFNKADWDAGSELSHDHKADCPWFQAYTFLQRIGAR